MVVLFSGVEKENLEIEERICKELHEGVGKR